MFTGIVSAIGEVARIAPGPVTRLEVRSPYDPATVDIGASISHAGACLTVIERRRSSEGMVHVVEAVPETLARTTLGKLNVGDAVNLERSLKLGDEFGGHIVAGHVDAVGVVRSVEEDGGSWRVVVAAPCEVMRLIAHKGNIAVDGVALTVTAVTNETFEVAIIPHTRECTTLGDLVEGYEVNLEADMLARYVDRMLGWKDKKR
ncbi:MAG: riboflavin synthase [Alphaproteobacteria bacterium]|nr:riboflavin synthase [Alphaproteobacteria bacterium]